MHKLFVKIAAFTASIIALIAVSAAPAAADPSASPYSSCSTTTPYTDCHLYVPYNLQNLADWSYFPEQCQGCATNNKGFTRLWQLILWRKYLPAGISCHSFTDGIFGPNTKNYTIQWQNSMGLTGSGADGRVGPNTWGRASYYRLSYHGDSNGWGYYEYNDGYFQGPIQIYARTEVITFTYIHYKFSIC